MRVLTVVHNLGIGGTQRVAQNLSISLASLGVDVAVLAFGAGGPREVPLREHNIPVFTSGTADADGVSAALRWRPDIVHIHRSGYVNQEETTLLRELRTVCRKVVETNIFARYDWGEGGGLIDAHCLLSKWCVFKWLAWGGARSGKPWFILPNPLDTETFRPLDQAQRNAVRAEFGFGKHDFVLGRVGQPAMEKWSYGTIDAFRLSLKRHDNLRLLLVSPPAQIIAQIATLPPEIAERINHVPTIMSDDRLLSLLSAMDAFLHMATAGETFGLVLCEAMLAGVPVVTQSTPLKDNGQLEVVGHEKGGLVALSQDAIPAAISRLVTDHEFRMAVKRDLPDWVKQRFAVDIVRKRAMEIYEHVLSDRRSPCGDDQPPGRPWIERMWSLGVGQPPSLKTRIMFELVHTPLIYRAYVATRFWK